MRAPLSGGWGANAVVLAHTFNDMHLPALSILVPVLGARHGLGLAQSVALATAYSSSAFFLQPLLGLWLDKRQGASLARGSSVLCGLGLAALVLPLPYPVLIGIALLGGAGSAIFHPHGSALLATAPGPRHTIMGWYGSSGNLGSAVTPLMLPPLVATVGVENAWPWLLVPGFMSFLLLSTAERGGLRYVGSGLGTEATAAEPFRLDTHVVAMLPLIMVVALRNWTSSGMTTLLPLYLGGESGLAWLMGTRQVSLMLVAGTIGAVAGGYLARRYGSRDVTAISLALSSVLFGLVITVGGGWTWLLIAAAGGSLLISFALTVLLAQEMLPSHRAYASGLSFGLGSGFAALGLGFSGWLAEQLGLATAVVFLAVLPLIGAAIALRLPSDRRLAGASTAPS